ncbi:MULTISPECIES: PTS system mannose/fructose/sorbose family transporter subunit IID [Anaerotruncus]|jgi:PTS family mannose/fructose/sorbose porter, IID component|uniref:PTS system mannose/fructose/sorbose family transporter subunit IID n=2 Tax=Anaerotruncus TaxID=244127 RepID=A0A498D2J3_9FIRM|nr:MULTISPECIES: PTS system mannose/fructose/sorbose family transporter subunit IID [Anaerotruncus]MBC3937699.1 PTS system mannose/fructose/sorbose family transporter subunit IID [Anaerotruncus massiliensis (ex Togo et al. 2019)]MCQ4895774.1 PTS system mannose/fructose/sorbose family transporter subunit IID [Anaerotruncus sp. DFI.9.16]RLL14804.1 PTS system mannose/fructose/sorbose family transporter subunit IID [Anaerotruncus massiliensis (ex Liu et al. 2021)]GKH46673.1 PTS N-acetylglucosamine 
MAKEKTGVVQSIVTKKDLLYAWFKWFIFSHCCINYERFESLGFTNAISHILAKLYPSKEDLSEALERHQEFFNTEPYIGIVIMGISVAMEEQRAKDGSVSGEAITAVKTGLMGPLAGIGDTLNQAIIYPILLAFSVALVLENNLGVAGVVIYCVLVVAAMAAQSIYFVNYGYRLGKDAVSKILKGGLMDRIVHAAGIVGCGVLGALTATYVSLSTTLTYGSGEQAISLQADFLDQLMPKMLPLAVTLVCFWLVKKGKGAIKIMGILAVGVVALSLLHII